MAIDPDRYRLSEDRHQAIFERDIKRDLFVQALPVEHPTAILLGGQPGAGKSAAVDAAVQELQTRGDSAQIIGDDLRPYHPEYRNLMARDDRTAASYTDRDTGRWVEKAIEEAKLQRVNIVIEGTMRDVEKVSATMRSLRDAGYEIDARALAVSFELSQQGILQRYEAQKADRGTGRLTTPEAHQAAFTGMLTTVGRIESDRLADRITVYTRGGEPIYRNQLKDAAWMEVPQARAVVEAERARPMTLHERKAYVAAFEKLATQLAAPDRNATRAEVEQVQALRVHALAAEPAAMGIVETAAARGLVIRDASEMRRDYAGKVVAASNSQVLLKISELVGVRYEKAALDTDLKVGDRVAIEYKERGASNVREFGKQNFSAKQQQLER